MAGSSHDHISQFLSEARKRGCIARSSTHCPKLLRVPKRMRRPSAAREALGFAPLVEARRTHAACLKGIPRMTALTEPVIFLAGRPAAERASDAWRLRISRLLLFLKLAIQYVGFRCPSHKTEVLLTQLIGLLRVAFA